MLFLCWFDEISHLCRFFCIYTRFLVKDKKTHGFGPSEQSTLLQGKLVSLLMSHGSFIVLGVIAWFLHDVRILDITNSVYICTWRYFLYLNITQTCINLICYWNTTVQSGSFQKIRFKIWSVKVYDHKSTEILVWLHSRYVTVRVLTTYSISWSVNILDSSWLWKCLQDSVPTIAVNNQRCVFFERRSTYVIRLNVHV